jgi:hypothetical protein
MKSIKPIITGITPAPPITINIADREVFGASGRLQLIVDLELTRDLPASAIVLLEIITPQLYLFTDGTNKKQYQIGINAQQVTAQLDF